MTAVRESNVTLIRVLINNDINIPVLVNLFQDDLYFKQKILLVDTNQYTDEEIKLLMLCCHKTNYNVESVSDLATTSPLSFVQFFRFGTTGEFKYNAEAIKTIQSSYEGDKINIIGQMCMMYYQNYIFLGNTDRILTLEKDKNIIKHYITPQLTNSSVFMKNKNDLSWSGNLYDECVSNKFLYTPLVFDDVFIDSFYENVSIIGHKNKCILSTKAITRKYYKNQLELWEGLDTTLRTGLFVFLRIRDANPKTIHVENNKALNHYTQTRDHEQYRKQRIEVIGLYNKLNINIPLNVRYAAFLCDRIEQNK